MASQGELCAQFAHDVEGEPRWEFLNWLCTIDAKVREITDGPGLTHFQNIGWVSLWDQAASDQECIDELRAFDFEFETAWLIWKDAHAKAG